VCLALSLSRRAADCGDLAPCVAAAVQRVDQIDFGLFEHL